MVLWKCVQIIHSFKWSTTLYSPTLVPSCGQIKEQRPHLFFLKQKTASVHCREQNMNYICYDKRNCPKWTKRINNSVRARIVVCFLQSGTSTRSVMEIREWYELFWMLYTATTNNSTPPWQHSIMPWWQTSAHPLVPSPNRGASLALLLNIQSRRYKTYIVPGQGRRACSTDRDVGWHLSLKVLTITGHWGQEGEQRYTPTISWLRYLDGGGGSKPRAGRFTPRKDPVPIVQEAGWAPGPAWTGAENLASTGIRSPDRPARSESLYRQSYSGPYFSLMFILFYRFVKPIVTMCTTWC